MSGYLILILIGLALVGVIFMMSKSHKSSITKKDDEIKSKDTMIKTQKESIESYRMEEEARLLGEKAGKSHTERVQEIKKKSNKVKEQIEEGMTDEDIKKAMSNMDNDNNSKL